MKKKNVLVLKLAFLSICFFRLIIKKNIILKVCQLSKFKYSNNPHTNNNTMTLSVHSVPMIAEQIYAVVKLEDNVKDRNLFGILKHVLLTCVTVVLLLGCNSSQSAPELGVKSTAPSAKSSFEKKSMC